MYNGIIYKQTSPSGKVYIGQTTNENKRKAQHKKDSFDEKSSAYNSPFIELLENMGLTLSNMKY